MQQRICRNKNRILSKIFVEMGESIIKENIYNGFCKYDKKISQKGEFFMSMQSTAMMAFYQEMDSLTKLHSRQSFYQELMHFPKNKDRHLPTTLVFFDILGLEYCSQWESGNTADIVLHAVGETIRQHLPDNAIAGRWSQHRLAVALPYTPMNLCQPWADMIVKSVEHLSFPYISPIYRQQIRLIWSAATSPPYELSRLPQQVENQLKQYYWAEQMDAKEIFLPREKLPYAQEFLFTLLHLKTPILKEFTIACMYYSEKLGQAIGLKKEQLQDLRLAALWQDVGHLNTPLELLLKTTPMTLPEKSIYDQHIMFSVAWAKNFGVPAHVVAMIAGHHYHWDGSDDPQRAKMQDVSIGCHILHLTSRFAAELQYLLRQIEPDFAEFLAQIRAGAGNIYHPELVEILLELAEDLPEPDVILACYEEQKKRMKQ